MKNFRLLFCSAIAVAVSACSSSKNVAPSNDVTREKAHAAYAEVDADEAPRASAPAVAAPSENKIRVTENSAPSPADLSYMPKPVILVMPAPNSQGASVQEVVASNPNARAAMEGVMEYLTKKGYEVKSLEGGAELDNVIQMQNDIAGTDDDLAYLASLSLSADVYIKFSGTINDQGQVMVELSAYETSTARQLGSQSSFVDSHGRVSQQDMQANLKTAARKAMGSLESKIQNYWIEDMKNGTPYKVIMNLKGEYTDTQLEDIQEDIVKNLKGVFNKVRVNTMTSQTIDLVVYANAEKIDDAQSAYSEIRGVMKSFAETKKVNVSKKLIIMDVK